MPLCLPTHTHTPIYPPQSTYTPTPHQGFCPPAELSDEQEGGEGATEFEDIEGGGMGEGEGAKDVSDQIENEDQLDDTRHKDDEEKETDNDQKPDIEDEENGIEMSEDMDGKMHDLENTSDQGQMTYTISMRLVDNYNIQCYSIYNNIACID